MKHISDADSKHNPHYPPKNYRNADIDELIRLAQHEARASRVAYSTGAVLSGDMAMHALEGYLHKLDAIL